MREAAPPQDDDSDSRSYNDDSRSYDEEYDANRTFRSDDNDDNDDASSASAAADDDGASSSPQQRRRGHPDSTQKQRDDGARAVVSGDDDDDDDYDDDDDASQGSGSYDDASGDASGALFEEQDRSRSHRSASCSATGSGARDNEDDDDDDRRSYVSGGGGEPYNAEEGEGSYSRNDEGSHSQEDGSQYSQERSLISRDDRSYDDDDDTDDDKSCISGDDVDDRSFISGEEDDHSHNSGEDHGSYFSGEQDDRSLASGEQEDRSFISGEQDDRSFVSGEQDDRSFVSGEEDGHREEQLSHVDGGEASFDGSDSQTMDESIQSRVSDGSQEHSLSDASFVSRNDRSHSQDEEKENSGSMSLSQLEEGSYSEDSSTSRRGDGESADLPTELPDARASPKISKPAAVLEENSIWLSELEKEVSDDYSSNSQQQASSSTVSQPNRSASENDDDDHRSAPPPPVEEKSLWLSSLEQASDDGYSEENKNSETGSQRDNSYVSREDGDPRDGSYSISHDSDDISRDEDLSQRDDSFDPGEADGSRHGRRDEVESQLGDSKELKDQDGSYSNSQGDEVANAQLDDSFVSGGSLSNSQRDESSNSHSASNSQPDDDGSQQQLDDSFASQDDERSHSKSLSPRDNDGSESQHLDDSFVSRDDDRSHSNDGSESQQLDDSFVLGQEGVSLTARKPDGESSHSDVQLEDSFVTLEDDKSLSISDHEEDESNSSPPPRNGVHVSTNMKRYDSKHNDDKSCSNSQQSDSNPRLDDSFVTDEEHLERQDKDGSYPNSLDESFVSRDGERSNSNSLCDGDDGLEADKSVSPSYDDESDSEDRSFSHHDASHIESDSLPEHSDKGKDPEILQSDSFVTGDTRHECSRFRESDHSKGRRSRTEFTKEDHGVSSVGSPRHTDDDCRQDRVDLYGFGSAATMKQRAGNDGGKLQQSVVADSFAFFANGGCSSASSEPSCGRRSAKARNDTEDSNKKDDPRGPSSPAAIHYQSSESESKDSCDDSSVSGFDSFANDASVASRRGKLDKDDGDSLHSTGQMEEDSLEEDVSVLSLLPADTFAQMGMSHPLNEPSVVSAASCGSASVGREAQDDCVSVGAGDSDSESIDTETLELSGYGDIDRGIEADASVRTFDDYNTHCEKDDDAAFTDKNFLYSSAGTFGEFSGSGFATFGEVEDNEVAEKVFGAINKGDFFGQNSIVSFGSKRSHEISESADDHGSGDGSQLEDSYVESIESGHIYADGRGSRDGSQLENSFAGSNGDDNESKDDCGSQDGSKLEGSIDGSNDSDHESAEGRDSQDGSQLEDSFVGSNISDHESADGCGSQDGSKMEDSFRSNESDASEDAEPAANIRAQSPESVSGSGGSGGDHSERSERSRHSAESCSESQYSGSSRNDSAAGGSPKEQQTEMGDDNTVVSSSSRSSAESKESDSFSHSERRGAGSEGSKSSISGSGSFAGDEYEKAQRSPLAERSGSGSLGSESTGSQSKGRSEHGSADGSKRAGVDEGSYSSSGSESSSGSYSDDSSSSNMSLLSELQTICNVTESSLRLPKPNAFGGYSREQMARLVTKARAAEASDKSTEAGSTSAPIRKKQQDRRERGKSEALLELVADVHDAMVQVEQEQGENTEGSKEADVLLTSGRLLFAFEALVGILLQLSDELELLLTFSKGKVSPAIEALDSLLAFSKTIDDTFMILKPIMHHYLTAEIDEELDDFLYGMNLLIDLLCELSNRVGEKQQWNARANTAFVTMLELLARDTLEVSCIYEDVDTPEYELTDLIQDAWEATGHVEEVKTLLVTTDLFMFRQICYEVMLSTDQWCPDNNTLMDICGVDDESDHGQVKPDEDDILSPPPEAALQILEKINGDPLPRTVTLASVLRRILPAQAITDPSISENFARIRNTIRNPLGMPPSSLVTITSIPESLDDPDALGVAGVGKTTLAAMVANHEDVRRFFNDGIAWIYVGETELNYNRYVQCLQDLLSQLEVEEDEEPLFPELLHIPGETYAMRRRRDEGFMIYLRETMVEFLRYKNVLVILDDVCFEPDLDWFDFAPAPLQAEEEEEDEGSCAILITSRRRNLLPPADTVDVDMLEEHEGVELLIKESGEVSRALIADAPETLSVVLECACHPLTIKSVGRWLNLKHATAGAGDTVEEMQQDVVKSMDKILKGGLQDDSDMMYEILNMSLSPAINGEPTSIIKFCFAAFVRVFCVRKHISDFALADSTPIVPMATTELLFESLLDLEEEALLQEGSLFYAQKKEAATLIPEALSALGVFKVIITYAESPEGSAEQEEDEKYLQIMHIIQQEYGEYLYEEDETLTELTKDGETRWNKAFSKAFLAREVEWDTQAPDAGVDYALEMLPSHMLRGGMLTEACKLLRNEKFVRGRLCALGRENGSRRHIKDSETLFDLLVEKRAAGQKRLDPKGIIRAAYDTLGSLLKMGEDEYIEEEGSPEAVEVGRCHFEIGFSLAGRRCWEGAISHWESSQEFLVSSLGMVELVAGILYNIGVVNAEMHEFEQALGSLKQCLRIRGAIHGEEHILYAQTIQKIGDVFLAMSDYHEAMESYNWALDVMHIEPSHHRIDIGDILEQMGKIHYSKGEIEESLQSFQDALRSKQVDLGEDHPELGTIFHQIGNCLSNQGRTDEAIAHLEEAIRLKKLDPDGGYERDSDVLTIEGILNNLNNMQKEGLECYEKSLQILVTKVPHKKEKVASLLHLIGCVYLMSGEHKKAMKLFEESLHARRKVLGFVHLDVASTLFNMAFLHQSRNRLDKALKCLEEALKIRQLRLPDSEKVAVTHEKIGNLARGIGKTKKAENAFTEALRIRKIIHGNSHEAVATVLQELGDLMDDLGEYEDAMKHYVEALEIRENRLGPDDLAVAETYYSMGFTLQNNGALDRALQCLEESLSIRKFQQGDDAKDVGDTLNMMGFLQAKRGELDDALSLLWDALRIRKLQEDHVKVSETLNNIGNVHREKQEYDLAIECYEECLRIRRAELGDEHEKVADALIAMGNVQSDMDYTEEAMDSYKEALAIRNMIFGEQDESVATVLQYMGTLEFRANELDRAFQLLDEFIRIRQENGTEQDGDYVNVLFMIGNIHKMQANEDEAKKCWTEAYGVFKQLGLAETNPQIAEVMGNLVKDEEVVAAPDHLGGMEKKAKSVLGRITAKVKKAARTANEAGNAVKKVTGIKSQDRGSQLL